MRGLKVFLTLTVSLLLISCGGGDGGGGDGGGGGTGVAGVTLSGTVTAPNGIIAKSRQNLLQWFASLVVDESIAQASQTVAGAKVYVFEINDDGSVFTSLSNSSGIILETITNGAGQFSVTLPLGLSLSSKLMVQASSKSGPVAIGATNDVLTCPVVRSSLQLNAGCETAMRMLVQNLPAGGSLTTNYLNNEVIALMGEIQTQAQGLSGTNIQDLVAQIQTNFQGTISAILAQIKNPGQPSQSRVNGAYRMAVHLVRDGADGSLLRVSGTVGLTFDPVTNTFTGSSDLHGGQLDVSCSSSCTRDKALFEVVGTDTYSGTYLVTDTNRLFLVDQDGDSSVGFINPAGTVVIVPFQDQTGTDLRGFGVATKQGNNLSGASVQGTYNSKFYQSELLPGGSSVAGYWGGPLRIESGEGAFTTSGSNITSTMSGSQVYQMVTCTLTGTTCSLAAWFNIFPASEGISGTFSINPSGLLDITAVGYGDILHGWVSADGAISLIPRSFPAGGALWIAPRQASALTNASVQGTYNLIVFMQLLDSQAGITTQLIEGSISFDGLGTQTFTSVGQAVKRMESCAGNGCGFSAPAVSIPSFTQARTYAVSPTGTLTITPPSGPQITGFVSPDASFIVTTQAGDNQPTGGTVTTSFKAIGIAVRE